MNTPTGTISTTCQPAPHPNESTRRCTSRRRGGVIRFTEGGELQMRVGRNGRLHVDEPNGSIRGTTHS
jgi:hypothetical protein